MHDLSNGIISIHLEQPYPGFKGYVTL